LSNTTGETPIEKGRSSKTPTGLTIEKEGKKRIKQTSWKGGEKRGPVETEKKVRGEVPVIGQVEIEQRASHSGSKGVGDKGCNR